MAFKLNESAKNVIINTGNILSLNDITKKPGQNPTEELVEALNITIKDFQNGGNLQSHVEQPLVITRRHDDLSNKMAEHEIGDLKIGLKVFIGSDNEQYLIEALEKAFTSLNINSVHNVIIAYHEKQNEGQNDIIGKIKNIWKTLESYARDKKIFQIGLSDIEENAFRSIYDWADVKPSIIQINLATCCVVPPTLQAFCKDNEVQLLTHSDPNEILPESSIESVFGIQLKLKWALRFLVHIKCRGVLTTKGYLVSLSNV
ncbi:hypothetical protein ILUMI_22627 [Ignelater luminosus]|uniref:GCS light chain n=1 Tax=Ignelater luminosus TaxID=2038154 RepID=A0A8K0CFH5_IGNLU|nr:hypothetical protein ILUMI_22627 [Ignelater luminosus]